MSKEVFTMNREIEETKAFHADLARQENIKQLLSEVEAALKERGYNATNQIAGYLISNDPAYISSYNNARSKIQSVERYEIIEELVRSYLYHKWCVLRVLT